MRDLTGQGLNQENHYLKFTLDGVPNPVVYRVSKETSERIERLFAGMSDSDMNITGVGFDTLAGRMVNLNPRHVLSCHVLWDAGRLSDEDEEESDLILYVRGLAEPITSWDSDLGELATMASTIESAAFDMNAFVFFTDQDGEVLFVKSDRVMLMDSVSYQSVLDEEMAEYEAEAKEADERKARAGSKRRAKKTKTAGPETAASDGH